MIWRRTSLRVLSAVLTFDEKDLGVCIVDIGGGTTDIAVYTNGALRHCAVVPVAGNQVTNDIAKIFRTPSSHAEQIKVQFACARSSMVSREDSIEVPSVGGRPSRSMSRHTLAEVVEPNRRRYRVNRWYGVDSRRGGHCGGNFWYAGSRRLTIAS